MDNSRSTIWETMGENTNQDISTALFIVVLHGSFVIVYDIGEKGHASLRTTQLLQNPKYSLNLIHCACQFYPHVLPESVYCNSNNIPIFKERWPQIPKWFFGFKHINGFKNINIYHEKLS